MRKYGIYPFVVFLGAFLLFQIQPLIGKYLLPWFGGASAFWVSCLLFFQLVLLGGYAYAHFLQRLKPRQQALLHCILLVLALLGSLGCVFAWGSPILPSIDWRPEQHGQPIRHIFLLLLISIGSAYFLLSASTSLLQAWFHRVEPTKSPYVFYVVSNTASLLALVCYPWLAEPLFTLKTQAFLWSLGFLIYTALCLLAVRSLWSIPTNTDGTQEFASAPPPRRRDYLTWIALAACGVLTLMAVTGQMTQDIPPVPFLWVMPLALYLLSYIVAFIDRLRIWRQGIYSALLLFGIYTACRMLIPNGTALTVKQQIVGYGLILFTICLFCHNSLYRCKPRPRFLTGFYFCISLGGALGGLFAAVIAPYLFPGYWEYQICLVLAAALGVLEIYRNQKSIAYSVRHGLWLAVLFLMVFLVRQEHASWPNTIHMQRNFYGVIRILKNTGTANQGKIKFPVYEMLHGQTRHGIQVDDPPLIDKPTAYYTETSGVGLAILDHPKRKANQPMRIGMVGMGIGTLAAYGRPGDVYRFYEINPVVIDLALNKPYFHYLRDSKAKIDVIEGDGRIQLEQELKNGGSQQYDVLVLDAYSGDALPVHLLTKEAFGLYLDHLAPGGVIAAHITNRYLNLVPVLQAIKDTYYLQGVLVHAQKDGPYAIASDWILLTRNLHTLPRGIDLSNDHPVLWSDEFSDLFSILK